MFKKDGTQISGPSKDIFHSRPTPFFVSRRFCQINQKKKIMIKM